MKLLIDILDNDYEFIKDLRSLIIGGRGGCKTIQYNVINAIKKGTPVYEHERLKGEWIIIDDTEQFIAKCSVCGRIEDSRMVIDYPFCHCGADMRKPNCVTCDHFGNCDECEKRNEE